MEAPAFAPITARDRLAIAQRHIAAGRMAEAEALLGELLRADPADPDVLNAWGGLALARKDAPRAADILAAAATAFPDHAGLVNNLGLAHQEQGRAEDALVCFERAVALAPDSDSALHTLAMARFFNGDPAGAREAADRLLARVPDSADALGLLGLVALAFGESEEAERRLRAALALRPDDAATLRALSVCCRERRLGAEALHLAERAHLCAPLDSDAMEHLARCEAEAGLFDRALATCRKLLAFAPNHLGMRELLARLLIVRGEPDLGIAELSRRVKAEPRSVEALLALAGALRFAGRPDQAAPFLDHAVKLAPDDPAILRRREELALARGRFPPPLEAAIDASALVVAPEGMSAPDFILLSRFLVRRARAGLPVRLMADDLFAPLAGSLVAPPRLVSDAAPDERAVPLPLLLRAFDLDADPVSADAPYMRADPERAATWFAALREHPRPWIGVLWESEPTGLSMAAVRAALLPAASAISLMMGAGRHELRHWPEAIDAGRHFNGFDDMIAAISQLDIVIGPDVAALHLAGALARPGLALVEAGFAWCWAAREGRALWYPSVGVVPQPRAGDWTQVVETARAALSLRLAEAAPSDPSCQ